MRTKSFEHFLSASIREFGTSSQPIHLPRHMKLRDQTIETWKIITFVDFKIFNEHFDTRQWTSLKLWELVPSKPQQRWFLLMKTVQRLFVPSMKSYNVAAAYHTSISAREIEGELTGNSRRNFKFYKVMIWLVTSLLNHISMI